MTDKHTHRRPPRTTQQIGKSSLPRSGRPMLWARTLNASWQEWTSRGTRAAVGPTECRGHHLYRSLIMGVILARSRPGRVLECRRRPWEIRRTSRSPPRSEPGTRPDPLPSRSHSARSQRRPSFQAVGAGTTGLGKKGRRPPRPSQLGASAGSAHANTQTVYVQHQAYHVVLSVSPFGVHP